MARYRKIAKEVEATQWFQNGDHPRDGPPDQEGRVVRYYRTPEVPGTERCRFCGQYMYDHGWVDVGCGGVIVCPSDWVVTISQGKYFVYTNYDFYGKYEPVG